MKKFEKHNSSKKLAIIRAKNTRITKREEVFLKHDEQILSPTDKIVWVYKTNKAFKVKEITTVSYVTTVGNNDYTVIYYDNSHGGVMHSHLRTSIQDSSDSPMILRVSKKGNQGNLLHWAIKDIMNNWYYYRKKFLLRSGLKQEF